MGGREKWCRVVLAAFALAPRVALAETTSAPAADGPTALPGVFRVPLAAPAAEGIGLAVSTGYGFTEGVLGDGDSHHRATGAFAASIAAARWLSVALRFDGRIDAHRDGSGGTESDAVGDPRLFVRAGGAVGNGFEMGAQAGLWLPGSDAPSIVAKALSLDLVGLATYRADGSSWIIAGEAGFRLDNSAKSAPDADRLSLAHRLALGLSESNAILLGLGALNRVSSRTELLAELSWDALVGPRAPSLGASPLRVAAGARWAPMADEPMRLQAVVEASPSERPFVGVGQPLLPIEPRFAVTISLVTRIGAPPLGTPARQTEVAPAIDTRHHLVLRGRVVDERHVAIPRAKITLKTANGTDGPFSSDADGAFELRDLEEGPGDLTIEAEGRVTSHIHVVIEPGASPSIEAALPRALPEGQIRGTIRNTNGKPIAASVRIEPLGVDIASDGEGTFRVDVAPGSYEVVVRANGYAEQRRKVVVDRDGVVLLNVDLRGSH